MVCTELSNMLKDASYTISDIDLAHLLLNLPILLTLLFSSPFVDMQTFKAVSPMGRSSGQFTLLKNLAKDTV